MPQRPTAVVGRQLYTLEERDRRDRSRWTVVQGVLAPLQLLAFLISLWLVLQFLRTGEGAEAATVSVIVKTAFLYAIMVTGAIWEKEVFGVWLFAKPFFWGRRGQHGRDSSALGLPLCIPDRRARFAKPNAPRTPRVRRVRPQCGAVFLQTDAGATQIGC